MLLIAANRADRLSERTNAAAARWAALYWRSPIPAQGMAPAAYHPFAKGLGAEDCGTCHPIQLRDWQASLHGFTMGPGVTAQLAGMSPQEQSDCAVCHAPMSEQWAGLSGSDGGWSPNGGFDAALSRQGLVCAACHLRTHVRNGPPLAAGRESVSQAYHGEPQRSPFFEASEFCNACHQHTPEYMAPNGKPVENVYQEWLASPFAAQGVTCQQCHMPERRHLWKGIHDPELTRSGVTITATVTPEAPRVGEPVRALLTLRNTGTGHAFPTYTTPAVRLQIAFLDAGGQPVASEAGAEHALQRVLDMNSSPWGELQDTRLFPGQSAEAALTGVVPAGAATLRFRVQVEPDEFYARFYEDRLRENPAEDVAAQYRLALERARATPYTLFQREVPLAAGQPRGARR
jgi:hypothetical protein